MHRLRTLKQAGLLLVLVHCAWPVSAQQPKPIPVSLRVVDGGGAPVNRPTVQVTVTAAHITNRILDADPFRRVGDGEYRGTIEATDEDLTNSWIIAVSVSGYKKRTFPPGQIPRENVRLTVTVRSVPPREPAAPAHYDAKWTVTLADTHGAAIDLPRITVTPERARDRAKLRGMKPFERVSPGTYQGVLPLDTEDYTIWNVTIDAAGFIARPLTMVLTPVDRTLTVTLMRDPRKWRPSFIPFDRLDASFQPLQRLLQAPLTLGTSPFSQIQLAPLSGRTYDTAQQVRADGTSVDLEGASLEQFTRAKMTLLNLYLALSEMGDPDVPSHKWIDDIVAIQKIQQERIIAKVKPRMWTAVYNLSQGYTDPCKCLAYRWTDPGLHTDALEDVLSFPLRDAASIKTPINGGSLQLTVARYHGTDEIVADIDLDEHDKLTNHALDVIRHRFNGGTDPYYIYEILGRAVDSRTLGYSMVLRP